MGLEGGEKSRVIEWETRPGGMLVQKRCDAVAARVESLVVVRVSHGAARYHISISSQATFGELKKLLSPEAGLQPGDQKLIYKGKERQNGEYLDLCGVKNKSKITLEEDPSSLERRYIEMQRNVRSQGLQRAISNISMDIDKLADQVTAIDELISNGTEVADVQITTLIELFMRLALRLDNIPTEGETSSQKIVQAKRVQKCVETLDVLKVSNVRANHVIVTTKWETFETPVTTHWEIFE